MRRIIKFFPVMLLPLLFLSLASPAFADRGMIPVSDVSVYGPGQKAIIAWNGTEEILILSTDVYASGDSMVLELLPLPAEPQRIEAGDFASFIQIEELMTRHIPPPPWWDRFGPGLSGDGEGIEIVFHQKIGAHDITVVKASDVAELIYWAEGFLEDRGMEYNISSPKLESVVGGYIEGGFEFFVFDLIELTSAPQSIEPILYRFETDFLYYPLVISSLASGETDITLFLLTRGVINFAELPEGMHTGLLYGEPARFEVDGAELRSINTEIAELLGDSAWLAVVQYEGKLENLESDLKLYSGRNTPELAFVSLGGSCTAEEGPTATISLRFDRVFFSGSVIAPTPCHRLEAELVIPNTLLYPQTIIVDITAQEIPGTICIQCLGEIPFKGEIRHLDPGEYEIQVCYQGSTLAQQRIEVPAEIEPLKLPLGTTLEVNPGQTLIKIDGTPVELSAPAIEVMIQAETGVEELRIEVDEIFEKTKITVNGVSAIAGETIGIEDSQLSLEAPQGWASVRVLPDEVLEVLLEQEIQSFELSAMDSKAVFVVEGIAEARLFGLFPINMTIKTTVDAQSGEIVQEEMPWWRVFCVLPQRGMSE